MSAPEKKNLAASVRQRLLVLSQKRKEPFDLILTRLRYRAAALSSQQVRLRGSFSFEGSDAFSCMEGF